MITGQTAEQQRANQETDGRALVALYAERVQMSAALARTEHLSGAMVEEVIAKGAELDSACEAYRRRYYPRRSAVICAGYTVLVCSATRRNVESVLDLHDEYRPHHAAQTS